MRSFITRILGKLRAVLRRSRRPQPWSHRFHNMTLEQAKAAARSRIRIPDESTRETVAGTTFYDAPGDPYVIANQSREVKISYIQRSHSNLNKDLERPNDVTFLNTRLLPVENTAHKWFCRMGNVGTLHVDTCSIVGTTGDHGYEEGQLRQYPMEHGFYCEIVDGALIKNALFEDLGGHGTYFCYRPRPKPPYKAKNKFFDRRPRYRITDCSYIDTEQDASRGSHSITFFDPGDVDFPGDILIDNTCVINGWDFERNQGTNERFDISDDTTRVRSCSNIVVHNYECFPTEDAWPTNSLTLRNVVFWSVKAKHSMGEIRNVREVLLEDCYFRAQDHRNPYLNIGARKGDPNFRTVEKLTIRNCKADGVKIRLQLDEDNYQIIDPNTVGTEIVIRP